MNLLQELGQAFAARYRMILDKSLNMQSHGSAEFTQTLAHTEVQRMRERKAKEGRERRKKKEGRDRLKMNCGEN